MFALNVNIVLLIGSGCLYSLSEAEAGTSTRYWDCCKPSCAWTGKAPFKTHPVNTCHKDGHTVEKSHDAKNICAGDGVGGPVYMCANQHPWAINNELSYGFAAANIKGHKESDWCCACYELTFTSTAVKGKKFIVQVTNTGGDLGGGHFDLQIPGGGVGIFNGCQAQYGTPHDGWGKRYGGVASANDCHQLPADLQKGCHWRFDWFHNADNPNHSFKRVKCPAELTSKTGCVRSDEHFF